MVAEEYSTLEKSIRSGDTELGVSEALRLIEEGVSPVVIFTECIEPLLDDIGDQFSRLEIFLPEMVNAASVVKAIHVAAKPHLEGDQETQTKGKIVIATVSGDLHDIGKNIVKAMLEVNGFEVHDLGVDIPTQTIVQRAEELQADLIALSALMLPSLPYVQDVIEFASVQNNLQVIVGGGPVSQEWAEKAGAAGYGDNAIDAVALVRDILS